MVITLDFSEFRQLLDISMLEALYRIFFWYFGWLPVAIAFLWGLIQLWLFERQHAWEHQQKFVLLAVDIPRQNAQSPRAVENLFVYLAGAHNTFTLIEKWWVGKMQLGFSFEIVSIGGVIQYLVHTPESFVHLVESAVYSQYPDAEIYEVEDYAAAAPSEFPDEEYDIWGSEFILASDWILPIRTYPEFEHQLGEPETTFRDPLAALMDLMSSLKKGEQLWYQIIVVPIGQSWTKEADRYADALIGRKSHESGNLIDKLLDAMVSWLSDFSEMIYKLWGDVEEKKPTQEKEPGFLDISPGTKNKLEGIARKAAKQGFEVSIRGLYLSRREVMDKPKAVNGFVGFIKQFNTGDLNSIKPDTKQTMTSATYFFTKKRLREKKRKIMQAYKHRSSHMGVPPWILNVEELASLWHFPLDSVTKAPLIQRAAARQVEPSTALPFADEVVLAHTREPIFDEGYLIEDEGQAGRSAGEESEAARRGEPSRPAKRPGFLEDTPEETTPEAPAAAARPLRGAPPPNLPFV